MIAVAGLPLPANGWQRTRDPQDAGHGQGPVDLGDHSPDSLQVHPPRVPKALGEHHRAIAGYCG
jgi:hypothetical protein